MRTTAAIIAVLISLTVSAQEITVSKDDPLHITSQSLTANNKTREVNYKGNVVVTHGGNILKAGKVTFLPENDTLTAEQDVHFFAKNGTKATGDRGKYIKVGKELTIIGKAVLESVGTDKVTTHVHSDSMKLEGDTDRATAFGNVLMERADITVKCQKADLIQAEDKVILEGNPLVTKVDDQFAGDKMTIYFKKRLLVADAGVKARFYAKAAEAVN